LANSGEIPSRWPGKYVIGLTGNIATGKSLVCNMLAELGAFCIDADVLAHQVMAAGTPGYEMVAKKFGKDILSENGEVNRTSLARMVFRDQAALKQLEQIIHPLVEKKVDQLVRESDQAVVVIEAIKLLEGGLADSCNAIWVTGSPEAVQKKRLREKRKMSEEDAMLRIHSQLAQEIKIAAANVVIQNDGTINQTRKQVQNAWETIPLHYREKTETVIK
jgi:dephospho-CoA kinase